MQNFVRRFGDYLDKAFSKNFFYRNPQPFFGGPIGRKNDTIPADEQSRFGKRLGELEELFWYHGRASYALKYSRPLTASACGVGLRYTATRQPASPRAIASSMTTLA